MITHRIVGDQLELFDTETERTYPLCVLSKGTTGDDLNWAEGLCYFIERRGKERLYPNETAVEKRWEEWE